jgi:ABC-type nitrate/sulfonate/bicarbonate transport system substrate-binding protein
MSTIKPLPILFLVLLAMISAVAPHAYSAERPGKPTLVRIGIASRSPLDMPYFVAQQRGFFRDEGLEAEIILMKAIQTVQSLLGGSIEFGTATGTAVSAAVSGADVRVVLALSDRPSFDLIAQPSITSVQQLRGKKIGVSAVGSLGEILARQILIAHQIPSNQVTILPLGISQLSYSALKAGVVDAIMASPPINYVAQEEGFRKLAAGSEVYRSMQGGLTTTRAIIAERPELVTKAIRATLRAVRLIKNDRKYGVEFVKGPFLEIGREHDRIAERVYDGAAEGYLLSGSVDEKLQREMIAAAAQRIKPAEPVMPERVFDFSFARKVSESLR